MVVDSDDEVAETLKDNPEDSPTPSCRADPHWQDAQGSPVLSPASSVPSLPSSSSRSVMTAAKTQPPKPRETDSAEMQAMKDQYAALRPKWRPCRN